jgi:K+-sensing histidine kinase KdpD
MLGHELRNPLAAISSAAAILRADGRSGEHLEFAGLVIERQSRHLKHLIDDLLDVGRVITGKILLDREPVNLGASARHVIEILHTAGRLKDRHIEQDIGAVWVQGDETRLEQILTNLLGNTARYTSPGGHIRVRVARKGDDAVLEVSDGQVALPSLHRWGGDNPVKVHRAVVIVSGRRAKEGRGKRARSPEGVSACGPCATRVTEATDSPTLFRHILE